MKASKIPTYWIEEKGEICLVAVNRMKNDRNGNPTYNCIVNVSMKNDSYIVTNYKSYGNEKQVAEEVVKKLLEGEE